MIEQRRSNFVILWAALLLAPFAWSMALGTMLPLTDYVCEHGSYTPIWLVGVVCLLLSLTAIAIGLMRLQKRPERSSAADQRSRFMLELAIGMSAIFALVILFYVIPVFMLGSCPT